jgi:tubulin monoglycylase TTLL3/8
MNALNINTITSLLEEAKPYFPQYNIDGYRNIWIVKPGALSRGRG